MKRILLALALLCAPSAAFAQCNGVFPNNTACGNISGAPGIPKQIPISSFPASTPGGSNGQVQYNNAGAFGGLTNPQLTALCQQFTSVLSGCVPLSGGGTANFLRADGTWATPPGTNLSTVVYYQCVNGAGDQSALAAALTSAQAIGTAGGTLHISGRCLLSAALTPTSNVTIEGDGMNSTFLAPNNTANICINFNPSGANKTVNIRHLTCTYASLTNSGVAGLQYGNASFNNIGGQIEWFDCTNCSSGIQLVNAINTVVSHSTVSPFYFEGIGITNPLLPDSGGNIIHDNYIQVFAPPIAGTIGVHWFSGGAFELHDNQIFAPTPVVIHASLQTSELNIHDNLLVGTGTVTAGIQVDAISAAFNCSQSTTNLTTSVVTGTIVVSNPGFSLGQTAFCNGTALGTIVSQTSGTPGGAGVYVTTGTATTSGTGTSTFILTELGIHGNTLDNTVRPFYVPQNIGGEWLYNAEFSLNKINSESNATTNQVTLYNTSGFTLIGNIFKCNGNCATGRPIFVDSSASKGLIVQGASSEIGTWGAATSISSTTTTQAAVFGGNTKTCGATIVVTNGIVTSC